MDILYTLAENDFLVFAERHRAESVARIRTACEEATTWGEFRDALKAEEFLEVLENLGEDPSDIDPSAAFSGDHVPGHTDGTYPEWLQQTMLEWIPAELIERFGETADSVHDGEAVELPANAADAIATELRALGHTVEHSDLDFL